jgi:hypothetical protein
MISIVAAPTFTPVSDPDVQNSRIRRFKVPLRDVT